MGLGTVLKWVERESLLKSFMLFFLSMGVLIGGLFYLYYKQEQLNLDRAIELEMNSCSFTLTCDAYQIDFIPKVDNTERTHELYRDEKALYVLYPIKKSDDFFLRIYLPLEAYAKQLSTIRVHLFGLFLVVLLLVALLSLGFSIYALHPLREALLLTREFIKDILHDLNTPIATMRLNLSLIQKEFGDDRRMRRIERAIENILLLQSNLNGYLFYHKITQEWIVLEQLIAERVEMIEKNFPQLHYRVDIPKGSRIETNQEALIRIIDNLLSNASKYNRENGEVEVGYDPRIRELFIRDTGKGIADPKRAFERFYKEHDRGIGIGLHIVKKLSKQLGIEVTIESKLEMGTTVYLKF